MPLSWLENEMARFLPVGDTQQDGNTTVRKVLIPWEYQYIADLKAALLGWTTMNIDGTLERRLPYKDPDQETQYCVRVTHQGYGYGADRILSSTFDDVDLENVPFTTAIAAKFWILTLYFQTLPYDVGNTSQVLGDPPIIYGGQPDGPGVEANRFAHKDVNPGREYINPPTGQFFLEGEPNAIPIPIPSILPFEELDTTWYQIPIEAYPFRAIRNCLGKTNKEIMYLPRLPDGQTAYPTETIHLLALRVIPTFSPYGARTVNIQYNFRFRPDTWNKFPKADGTLVRIFRGSNTGPKGLFDTAEFNSLFKSDELYVP